VRCTCRMSLAQRPECSTEWAGRQRSVVARRAVPGQGYSQHARSGRPSAKLRGTGTIDEKTCRRQRTSRFGVCGAVITSKRRRVSPTNRTIRHDETSYGLASTSSMRSSAASMAAKIWVPLGGIPIPPFNLIGARREVNTSRSSFGGSAQVGNVVATTRRVRVTMTDRMRASRRSR
jgi:hypothetical protein